MMQSWKGHYFTSNISILVLCLKARTRAYKKYQIFNLQSTLHCKKKKKKPAKKKKERNGMVRGKYLNISGAITCTEKNLQ